MFRTYRKGSLTVEASLVLPLFMTGLLTLVSSLYMCLLTQKIQASLLQTAQHLAVTMAEGDEPSLADVRDYLTKDLTDADLRFIENGADGLDLSGSDIDDGEYISLDVSCSFVPLTDALGIIRVPFSRRCLTHVWNGYGRGMFADDEYVYITEDSEVYHLDRNCSHLRLTVQKTYASEVQSLRNNSGSRYRPCGICHAKLSDESLFITPEGDRYHNSITCSGLKRTVRAIRKSEAAGRRPCSRCGR